MQFKVFASLLLVCMSTLVAAAPVPSPQLDVESRELAGSEINNEVAREAAPEPVCSRFQCW